MVSAARRPQAPIVFSIGTVISLSAFLVAYEAVREGTAAETRDRRHAPWRIQGSGLEAQRNSKSAGAQRQVGSATRKAPEWPSAGVRELRHSSRPAPQGLVRLLYAVTSWRAQVVRAKDSTGTKVLRKSEFSPTVKDRIAVLIRKL